LPISFLKNNIPFFLNENSISFLQIIKIFFLGTESNTKNISKWMMN